MLNRCLSMLLLLTLALPAQRSFVHHATRDYSYVTVRGHGIYISPEAWARQALVKKVLAKLETDVQQMENRLPAPAVSKLARVPIWIEDADPAIPGGTYHPDRRWLQEHGFNPDKAGGIELGNMENYLEWTRIQPFMLLHEMSHAYHHQVATFQNTTIPWAYDLAVKSHKYDSVGYAAGGKKRAYALDNDREYFAEMSEAYFGRNDFYPYNRAELAQFDPAAISMIERVWLGR